MGRSRSRSRSRSRTRSRSRSRDRRSRSRSRDRRKSDRKRSRSRDRRSSAKKSRKYSRSRSRSSSSWSRSRSRSESSSRSRGRGKKSDRKSSSSKKKASRGSAKKSKKSRREKKKKKKKDESSDDDKEEDEAEDEDTGSDEEDEPKDKKGKEKSSKSHSKDKSKEKGGSRSSRTKDDKSKSKDKKPRSGKKQKRSDSSDSSDSKKDEAGGDDQPADAAEAEGAKDGVKEEEEEEEAATESKVPKWKQALMDEEAVEAAKAAKAATEQAAVAAAEAAAKAAAEAAPAAAYEAAEAARQARQAGRAAESSGPDDELAQSAGKRRAFTEQTEPVEVDELEEVCRPARAQRCRPNFTLVSALARLGTAPCSRLSTPQEEEEEEEEASAQAQAQAQEEEEEEEELEPDVESQSSPLIRALAQSHNGTGHRELTLAQLSLPALWRLRRVCRCFRRWGSEALAVLPNVVVVGGYRWDDADAAETVSTVECLDLSTMRWSDGGFGPLPAPAAYLGCGFFSPAQLVVAGGISALGPPEVRSIATVAVPSPGEPWAVRPELGAERVGAASTVLADGRLLMLGGGSQKAWLSSCEALAADGSGWAELCPMGSPRGFACAGLLPDGTVLVAGGRSAGGDSAVLGSTEIWDPATGQWHAGPPMVHPRSAAAGCVLPSGGFVVAGGFGSDGDERSDAEVFENGAWRPLRPAAAGRSGGMEERAEGAAVAVLGGMVLVGGSFDVPELYEEATGQWFALPRAMSTGPRLGCAATVYRDSRFD